MDFRRIELIFIAIFIALDIYLFISLQQNQNVDTAAITTSKTSQILKDLKDDQISVKRLPNKKVAGYYLASRQQSQIEVLRSKAATLGNQTISFDAARHQLTSHFRQPIDYRKGEAVAATKALMVSTTNVALAKHYSYSPELSTGEQIVYLQKVPNGQMMDEDGQLVFKLEDGQITGYTQTYAANLMILREKEMTKVGAREAVINLYTDNEIPNNSRINWVKLGYTSLLDAKGSTVYIPTWTVSIENKSSKNRVLKRINAFTGALMKTASDVQ